MRVVAGLAGRSIGWLSEIERGIRPLDSRRDTAKLAEVLGVSVVDLTGQPYTPVDAPAADAQMAVRDVRQALHELPEPSLSADVEQLAQESQALAVARAELDLPVIGMMLPSLITRLKASVPGARKVERLRLLKMTFWTCQGAHGFAKNLGHLDLAWIAAEHVKAAALELDDPAWVAAAEFSRAHALIPTGAFHAAARYASEGAELAARTKGADAAGAHGALLLVAAYAQGHAGLVDEATDRLADAAQLATRPIGRVFTSGMSFGSANVGLHRVQVAIEAQRPERALAAGRDVVLADLPTAERRAAFWVDMGRANADLKQDEAAVTALRNGEREAAYRVQLHPLARESVSAMLERPHPEPLAREIRALAFRMGLPHS